MFSVLNTPDMIAALVALLAAVVARLASSISRNQKTTEETMSRMNAHIARAARAAEAAESGVHNDHATNLRDDLDDKFSQVLSRLDVLGSAVDGLREDGRRQERQISRLEDQVEGVRNDARTDRAHLYSEVSDLHDRIDRVKTVTKEMREP